MSRPSFQKRQKELKRQEKQRMKAARRAEKKAANRKEPAAQDGIPAPDAIDADVSRDNPAATQAEMPARA
jgi:hypothetical protein